MDIKGSVQYAQVTPAAGYHSNSCDYRITFTNHFGKKWDVLRHYSRFIFLHDVIELEAPQFVSAPFPSNARGFSFMKLSLAAHEEKRRSHLELWLNEALANYAVFPDGIIISTIHDFVDEPKEDPSDEPDNIEDGDDYNPQNDSFPTSIGSSSSSIGLPNSGSAENVQESQAPSMGRISTSARSPPPSNRTYPGTLNNVSPVSSRSSNKVKLSSKSQSPSLITATNSNNNNSNNINDSTLYGQLLRSTSDLDFFLSMLTPFSSIQTNSLVLTRNNNVIISSCMKNSSFQLSSLHSNVWKDFVLELCLLLWLPATYLCCDVLLIQLVTIHETIFSAFSSDVLRSVFCWCACIAVMTVKQQVDRRMRLLKFVPSYLQVCQLN